MLEARLVVVALMLAMVIGVVMTVLVEAVAAAADFFFVVSDLIVADVLAVPLPRLLVLEESILLLA